MLKDVQSRRDRRKVPIQKAGIKDLNYPIAVLDRENKVQHTVAEVSMYVDLPHHFKGTHMSRFVEILNESRGNISLRNISAILRTMSRRFASKTANLEIHFPYFIEKTAPVSGAKSLMNYQCAFLARYSRQPRPQKFDLIVEVKTPISTLCPCSKAISNMSAHNQRAILTIQVRSHELVWIEELIEIAESEASAELYSLLKRKDEKYITERAYRRPRFAEDIARAVARKLQRDRRIAWFKIESESMESIHNHNAYAMVTSDFMKSERRRL
ncbi:MAG: GTP cyclohydrolase FolE2 [Kiritimatiellia bacterium]|nr:GTP cyclohydrolase FolE2 [Kiritimatiellia bacterium]